MIRRLCSETLLAKRTDFEPDSFVLDELSSTCATSKTEPSSRPLSGKKKKKKAN